ncbi:ATP-dependent endonuclease [Arthrobacter sp. UYEF3]|uniref:ATP-dependent nuclease n=1 Tax=Arthrobacter sp. UYEF3 TaxID=1756365 RepID=UPI00339689C4
MRVAKISIENFRLLESVSMELETDATMIVGRNNSGKTSVVEIFYKFLGTDRNLFTLDDFSFSAQKQIIEAEKKWLAAQDEKQQGLDESALETETAAVADLPSIELRIEIEYEESDLLTPISGLIRDLDPTRKDAVISCKLQPTRPLELLKQFQAAKTKKATLTLLEFLRKKFGSAYSLLFQAVDRQDARNYKEIDRTQARNAVTTEFIYAQNQFDDTSQDTSKGLSRGFEAYYKAISDTEQSIENLEGVLGSFAEQLDGEYKTLFDGVFTDLRSFGVNTTPLVQELQVVSKFNAADLLSGNTRVVYAHEDAMLPESHNGLGYSKLIFIILQFVAFFEEYRKRTPRAGMQILFIEEPEAHLHPQMQAVFIKNIRDYVLSKDGWNVQIVVTTHSSHIIAESGFSCIRYLKKTSQGAEVRDLRKFKADLESKAKASAKAKDKEEKSAEELEAEASVSTLKFLEQYLVLHRCDMFFADKIVLIEGTSERLVLPSMIKNGAPELIHQYISVIEVGGAYAVKFKSLLEFIGVPTLVITDIDAVEHTGRHKKTEVSTQAAITSNNTLKTWLPGKSKISELLAASAESKSSGNIRVAYQVPEGPGLKCGRSFEESFILANAAKFSSTQQNLANIHLFETESRRMSTDEIREDSYNIADQIESKADFAFDVVTLGESDTPKYIAEGLEWLTSTN